MTLKIKKNKTRIKYESVIDQKLQQCRDLNMYKVGFIISIYFCF